MPAKIDVLLALVAGDPTKTDTAKGIAIVLKEGGSLRDYEGFQVLKRPQTPHVAIPTTAGTGSEVTYVAVIKDHEAHQKPLFGDYNIIPNTALLDPDLTVGLPPHLTAATGMDAMSHAVEAIHSQQNEPIADGLALHAIRLIAEFLPRAVEDGGSWHEPPALCRSASRLRVLQTDADEVMGFRVVCLVME